jgi:hypothetical protein
VGSSELGPIYWRTGHPRGPAEPHAEYPDIDLRVTAQGMSEKTARHIRRFPPEAERPGIEGL